mmetsp:Transcript_61130/g.144338  ORF Transcript_61130/g.144338 Transcript_61130/m.144338 type:complete len:120 (+) Transcript_61130:34-393(+)
MAVSLAEKFSLFSEHWRPKNVASVNNHEVKVVKTKGVFPWHTHAEEDEMFMVHRGVFRVEYRDKIVTLHPGELHVVPHGVEHRTASDEEAEVVIIEPRGVKNTGDVDDETFTAPRDVAI